MEGDVRDREILHPPGRVGQDDGGEDAVGARGQARQHAGGVALVARLAEEEAVDGDGRVGGQNHGVGRRRAGRDRLGQGNPADVGLRPLPFLRGLVGVTGSTVKGTPAAVSSSARRGEVEARTRRTGDHTGEWPE